MKKLLSVLMTIMLLTCSFGAVAEEYEVPEGYPEIRIDPATGLPYNLNGQTVYVYDYWTDYDWHEVTPSTEWQQAEYEYRCWIERTYNCVIMNQQKGDWMTCLDEMLDFAENPDGSLAVFVVEPGKAGTMISSGAAADWSQSQTIDLTGDKWNQATMSYASAGDAVQGVSTGASEPRQCLFFNKRILEEAGIDWNDIYDMQKDGTWTWDKLEEVLAATTQDLDGDGYADYSGITGNTDDMYKMGVFSNGGSFFNYNENGEIELTLTDEKSMAGLEWAEELWKEYAKEMPDGANWDWYKQAWYNGETAFYMYQAYGGFSDYSEMTGMEDEWGCVAFPKGPEGDRYVTISSENMYVIPDVYDQDQLDQLTLIYDLWTNPTPGYDDEDSWIGNKYDYADERAIEETYAMLRDPANGVPDYSGHLGNSNDVLGSNLLWYLGGDIPAKDIVESSTPAWQQMVDDYNAKLNNGTPVIDLSGYEHFTLPSDLTTIEASALANTGAQVIIVPDGCETIAANAFKDCSELLYVVLPGSVTNFGYDIFAGCTQLVMVLVEADSPAAEYCEAFSLTTGLIEHAVFTAEEAAAALAVTE